MKHNFKLCKLNVSIGMNYHKKDQKLCYQFFTNEIQFSIFSCTCKIDFSIISINLERINSVFQIQS
jgi:hypothetical protein